MYLFLKYKMFYIITKYSVLSNVAWPQRKSVVIQAKLPVQLNLLFIHWEVSKVCCSIIIIFLLFNFTKIREGLLSKGLSDPPKHT